MLVLHRKRGEKLYIGDSIVVVVLDFGGTNVKIGVSAPPNVPVHREEVYVLNKSRQGER